MRSLIGLCALALSLLSSAAQASVESCAERLLLSPADVLYADLQVTPTQAGQIGAIRDRLAAEQTALQAELSQVETQLAQASAEGLYADQLLALQSRQSWIAQELPSVQTAAESRVANVLTLWQRDRCIALEAQSGVVSPLPVVTVPVPFPVHQPVMVRRPPLPYRPVWHRPAAYPRPVPPVRRWPIYAPPAPPVRRFAVSPLRPTFRSGPLIAHAQAPASHAHSASSPRGRRY